MPKPWIEIIHFPFNIGTGEIQKESEPTPTLGKSENKAKILVKSEIEPGSNEKEGSIIINEIDSDYFEITSLKESESVNDGQEYDLETRTLKEESESVNGGQEYNLETLKEDSESRNYTDEHNLDKSDLNRINLGNPRVFMNLI